MTSHVTVGEKAILGLSNSDLATLLQDNRNAFRSGTLYPDMSLKYLQDKGGTWLSQSDVLSHGSGNAEYGFPGIANEYLRKLQADCPSLTATAECQEATAFYFGMLNHLVADATWHKSLIYSELKNNCEPGVTDVERWHLFGDTDLDICLAKKLNSFPAYSYFTAGQTVTGEFSVDVFNLPTNQAELAAKCPSSSELATIGCYTCSSGYTYDGNGPNSGCYKDVTTTMVLSGGDVPQQYNYWGTWYGCPSGYTHDGWVIFNLDGICTKRLRQDASFAKFPNQGLPICDSGQSLAGGCYSCTGGYQYPNDLITAGVTDPRQSACYKVDTGVVNCDLIAEAELPPVPRTFNEYFDMNSYITSHTGTQQNANAASFPANSTVGYGYMHSVYGIMGKGAAFSSSTALRSSADKILDDQFKKEHVVPLSPGSYFTADAKKCDWGYQHLTDASGGITDSALEVRDFWDATWDAINNGYSAQDTQGQLAIWRTGSFNYGVFVNGSAVNCIYGSGCNGTELRYAYPAAGGSVSTDTGMPETDDLVDTMVTTPNAGVVSIFEQSYRSDGADLNVKVYAPGASVSIPITVDFLFRVSVSGQPISIYKDSSLVVPCADSSGSALPNPCIANETFDADGLHVRVLASTDGIYSFKDGTGALLLDSEGDGVLDSYDNCPAVVNQDQTDTDVDGEGDACDPDDDNDTVDDVDDNCPLIANPGLEDIDIDGIGDACDTDNDNDGMPDDWELGFGLDPFVPADSSTDTDGDGIADIQEYQFGRDPIVSNKMPTPPILNSPFHGSAGIKMPTTFTWYPSFDAEGDNLAYALYVCEGDMSFGAPCDTPVNSTAIAALSPAARRSGQVWAGAGIVLVGILITGGISGRRRITLMVFIVILTGAMLLSCGNRAENDKKFYQVTGLNPATTYYWKVTVSDGNGGQTESNVWSFTTE